MGRFGVPCWRPLDSDGPPKLFFSQNQNKLSKTGDQERCQNKDEITIKNRCEQECHERQTLIFCFSHFTCCYLTGFSFCEIRWKTEVQQLSTITQHQQRRVRTLRCSCVSDKGIFPPNIRMRSSFLLAVTVLVVIVGFLFGGIPPGKTVSVLKKDPLDNTRNNSFSETFLGETLAWKSM